MRAAVCALVVAVAGAGIAAAEEPEAPATPAEIVAYRASGEWDADLAAVTARAARAIRRAARVPGRPALVLDVDDTSLSSYACLRRVGFRRAAARCGERRDLPAIPQTLALFRTARARGVAVVFLTGRRAELRAGTVANLRGAGYGGRWRLVMRPDREAPGTHDAFKRRARRALVRGGLRIVANVGDQHSDLRGGWAERTYKLPNPMYVIP